MAFLFEPAEGQVSSFVFDMISAAAPQLCCFPEDGYQQGCLQAALPYQFSITGVSDIAFIAGGIGEARVSMVQISFPFSGKGKLPLIHIQTGSHTSSAASRQIIVSNALSCLEPEAAKALHRPVGV
jgi:hypothetical protein